MVLLLYLANDKVNGVAKSESADKSTLVVILDNLYHQVYCILYNLLKCHKKSIKVAINASFCISVAIKQFSLELKRFLSQEVNI